MNVLLFALLFSFQSDSGDLAPLHMFQCTKGRWEKVYVTSRSELERLKKTENYEYQKLIGYGSSKGGDGLIKLRRAYRDGWHIFYTKLPRGEVLPKGTRLEEFDLWVWEKDGEGRIPIYGVSNQDWRNMRYYTTREEAKEAIQIVKDVKGQKLKDHGIVFYLMPAEETAETSK